MFFETEESRKAIGDVDVVYHDGLYHLFHLVLPNHDFIAHAVSTDGMNWRRVSNALFIGDPGSWDDLMLWTMHVSPDPHHPGRWRMFYTGLSRRERGRLQRIGMAISDDLYHWQRGPVNWRDRRGPNDPEPVKRARRLSQRRHQQRRRHQRRSNPHHSGLQHAVRPEPTRWASETEPWDSYRPRPSWRPPGPARRRARSRRRRSASQGRKPGMSARGWRARAALPAWMRRRASV